MDAGLRIDNYAWRGGREPMLRFGPEGGPTVVLALPLFEEANRARAFGVSILRALTARDVGGVLPELPGQGESELATAELRLADIRAAFAGVPGSHVVAIRSGTLVVDDRPSWLLTPQTGAELLRELARVKGGRLDGREVEVAGNILSSDLIDALSIHPRAGRDPATPRHDSAENASSLDPGLRRGGARVVRLAGDPNPADAKVDGQPLWRRAEPDNDPILARALADDIRNWLATCAA